MPPSSPRIRGPCEPAPVSAYKNFGSSEEFVGEFWIGELAEHVIQREFGDAEGAIAVRFSRGDFGFVVQPVYDAT